jgi:hypothetical protein
LAPRFTGPCPGLVPDSDCGPGCLSAGRRVSLSAHWLPAQTVVRPFGWRTLGVPGREWGAAGRTPDPCTGRAEGSGARSTPGRGSSPARGDGVVTHPGTSFALNVVPAGAGGSHFRCEFLHTTVLPRLLRGSMLVAGSTAHSRGALDPHPDSTPPTGLHLRIRPFYQEHAGVCVVEPGLTRRSLFGLLVSLTRKSNP